MLTDVSNSFSRHSKLPYREPSKFGLGVVQMGSLTANFRLWAFTRDPRMESYVRNCPLWAFDWNPLCGILASRSLVRDVSIRAFRFGFCSKWIRLASFIWGRSFRILVCSLSFRITRLLFVVWWRAFRPPTVSFLYKMTQKQISKSRAKQKKSSRKIDFWLWDGLLHEEMFVTPMWEML